jgi:hypothetical protein
VPADLEARLLAAIPALPPIQRRRWVVWAGAAGALAAACVLVVLAWPWHAGKGPATTASAYPVPIRGPDDPLGSASWRHLRTVAEEADAPVFTWPLAQTSPIRPSDSIPAELLD